MQRGRGARARGSTPQKQPQTLTQTSSNTTSPAPSRTSSAVPPASPVTPKPIPAEVDHIAIDKIIDKRRKEINDLRPYQLNGTQFYLIAPKNPIELAIRASLYEFRSAGIKGICRCGDRSGDDLDSLLADLSNNYSLSFSYRDLTAEQESSVVTARRLDTIYEARQFLEPLLIFHWQQSVAFKDIPRCLTWTDPLVCEHSTMESASAALFLKESGNDLFRRWKLTWALVTTDPSCSKVDWNKMCGIIVPRGVEDDVLDAWTTVETARFSDDSEVVYTCYELILDDINFE
jgi:hypothetical protein